MNGVTIVMSIVYGALVAYGVLILLQTVTILFIKKTNRHIGKSTMPISIIIPCRNEENQIVNLIHDLNALIETNFEVIFIDDHSEDNTKKVIEDVATGDYQILSSEAEGKKSALAMGVQKAKYNVVASLDADVRIGKQWLGAIQEFFSNSEKKLLILPIVTKKERGFWGHFEALDVLALTGTTLAWALLNRPILCNGANMAFRKDPFLKFRVDPIDQSLVSGDDVFFMHQIRSDDKNAVGILSDSRVVAHTSAFNNRAKLLNQRKRWASKSLYYNDIATLGVATIVLLMNLIILILGIASLFYGWLINLFLTILLGKIIIDFLFLVLLATKFNKTKTLIYYPFSALVQVVFTPWIFVVAQLGKFEWKGRQYNR